MTHNDYINRFLFDDTDIRGEIVAMEKTFFNACEHQHFPQALKPLLGEFFAAAALLAEVLKFEGILTLQARGEGDVAIIMAEATDEGNLRGILRLNPDRQPRELSDTTLNTLLGSNATLCITIDPVRGQRYQGIIAVNHHTLAQCLEEYFHQSEQLPTQIQLFANEKNCGGLFLQCLPAQIVTDAALREDRWQTCTQLAATLSERELFDLHNEEVLLRLFHEMQCRVFTQKATRFRCVCDRERSANALQSLGFEDALALLRERDVITIDCQFCGKVYRFGEADLADTFPKGDSALH